MNFLWCEVCSNSVLIFTGFLSSVAVILFWFICVFELVRLIYKSFKEKKIMFSKIVFLVIFFVIVFIVAGILSNLFMEHFVDIEPSYSLGDYVSTNEEKLSFSRDYLKLWLFGISIFGYLYYKISNYIVEVRKLSKKILYAVYGVFVIFLAVATLMFFKSYDYFIENIDDYYDCYTDCGS